MRNIILSVIGVLVIVGAIFAAIKISESNDKPKPEVKKVVKTVFVEEVKNGTVPITIPANGSLVAKNRLELYAEVQGVFRSSAHDFKAGQSYRRGETLIRIDGAEFNASIQSARSEFSNLLTSLMPDLRLDYPEAFPQWQEYLEKFSVDKSIPDLPEITSDNVRYFITGRGVSAAYYNIKNLEQRSYKYRITAPFSGIVTEALVTNGTLIRQGQKLGEFIDTSVFELELSISKNLSDLLKIGEDVSLKTVNGNKSYTGKVVRVNGRVDQATQTIGVFVQVDGDDLKEGMYLESLLEAKNEQNAIELSRKLLVDQNKIFVLKDSILDVMEVNPVYFSPDKMVVKGIPDGTKVLSKSVPGAYAGMLVKENKEQTQTPE
ncbi:efflux RND transporter periplasmic adaptor subunit [Dokdonia sp. 4H-3-7-5]|uniref:efflux RND transporter periplasmic adaptor subunit n=1 Tax=Dokdonia sp. (strain 4H-3-7-5) TaxID=983548 RepID=UPI00020A6F73|nr:HlyD family efflux transporter periplasmic adaptor subunit [Dokdonia sp. 4H-3-7-5]AEE19672.1 efflux transporter, RND family, MFP subunit [Dokdonia sp. 4H-3-7-5]